MDVVQNLGRHRAQQQPAEQAVPVRRDHHQVHRVVAREFRDLHLWIAHRRQPRGWRFEALHRQLVQVRLQRVLQRLGIGPGRRRNQARRRNPGGRHDAEHRNLGVKLVCQRANVGDGGHSGGREIEREKDVFDGRHWASTILLKGL